MHILDSQCMLSKVSAAFLLVESEVSFSAFLYWNCLFFTQMLAYQSELFIFFTLRFHIDKQFMMECPRPLVIKKINCSLVTTSHNRTSSFFVFSFSSSIHQSCFIWAYPQILSRYRKKNNKIYCQPYVGEKDPISQKNSIFLLKLLMFLIHVDLIGLSGLF